MVYISLSDREESGILLPLQVVERRKRSILGGGETEETRNEKKNPENYPVVRLSEGGLGGTGECRLSV